MLTESLSEREWLSTGSDIMKALSFGEILWDIDGNVKTIGGAPLNVLGHISKLGGNCTIISAVGDDDLGKHSMSILDNLGIDRSFVNISRYETGKALISLKDGIPSYSFTDPSAWDDISLSVIHKELLNNQLYDVFIFGTLASRYSVSRETLYYLLNNVKASQFFFDVNLRLSFYSVDLIKECLKHTTILKLNNDEVSVIASMLEITEKDFPAEMQRQFPIEHVLISLGGKGSVCFSGSDVIYSYANDVEVIDTVGAGDSLSAAFLYFLSSGENVAQSLNKASILADFVVSRRGAIPEYNTQLIEKLFK